MPEITVTRIDVGAKHSYKDFRAMLDVQAALRPAEGGGVLATPETFETVHALLLKYCATDDGSDLEAALGELSVVDIIELFTAILRVPKEATDVAVPLASAGGSGGGSSANGRTTVSPRRRGSSRGD